MSERISCNQCYRLLYIQFDESECDYRYERCYEDVFECDGVFFCEDCIVQCKKCTRNIEKVENINYCKKCYKIVLLTSTYNDITKNLPLELIYEIQKAYYNKSYYKLK